LESNWSGEIFFLEKITIYFFWYESFYTFAQEERRKKKEERRKKKEERRKKKEERRKKKEERRKKNFFVLITQPAL
jgi:hypothetical protein